MTSPIPYRPMATEADLRDTPFKYSLTGASETYIASTLARASRTIEARCARRFVPFGPITQSERAEGVTLESSGNTDVPLSLTGTLMLSRARAYGQQSDLVRDVWLDEYAPLYPELWTYTNVSVLIVPPFGGQGQAITGNLVGPQPDTGHLRLPFGTYCPVGSILNVTYSGGYTGGYPDDLVQATMMQAVRLLILSISPEKRDQLSTTDLEAEIVSLIAPYARA